MPDFDPSSAFHYGIPTPNSVTDAVEIEANLRALAQTHYTIDNDKPDPTTAKEGQLRINASVPDSITLDVFLNGAWTLLCPLGGSSGTAIVTTVPVGPPDTPVWTIDHNRGQKPIVQVADSSFRLLRIESPINQPSEAIECGYVAAASGSTKQSPNDQGRNPSATVGDFASTGLAITATPVGYVAVYVNHARYRVGDGVRTRDCYFSADGGTTARAISAIVATDVLYWNQTISGFNLDVGDVVDLAYLESTGGGAALTPPSLIGGFNAPWDGFVVGAYAVVESALTGSPNIQLRPLIAGTPVTGGTVSVVGAQAIASVVNGSAVTAGNKFTAGQAVRVRLEAGSVLQDGGAFVAVLLIQRADFCYVQHINSNRLVVTHPEDRSGYVIFVG